jgi:hypothetical protein
MNSIFKVSQNEPASIYYKDFDRNGSLDAVLCSYIDGISYPIHNRDRMLDHMVMLRKRFTRYEPYANATISDIFTPEELMNVKILKANHFQHTLFINQNGNVFKPQSLPDQTQISVMNDVFISDLNGDGKKDIITGGNFYGTDAEYGRYDASIGTVLINKGNTTFEAIAPTESGFVIPGNVRHMQPIIINNITHLLIVRNNDSCSLIKLNK